MNELDRYAVSLENMEVLRAQVEALEAWKAEELALMNPLMDYARSVCTGQLGCSLTEWLVEDHKRLAALSANHSEQVRDWIPVSERLPENENPVLVVVGDEVITASYWRHGDKHHGVDGWADSFSNDELEGVTHWMPLPTAPSAGSQKEQGE